ncbi:MAG: HTH domain-containing protein [Bacteroidia bacterium]
MILINKYETAISIDEAFVQYQHQYEELKKIFDFIDLPEAIIETEQMNSSILRNYYANAIDHNLLEVKTVKYIVSRNIRPTGAAEAAVFQYYKAEKYLFDNLNEPLSISLVYHLHKILVTDLLSQSSDSNLFDNKTFLQPERLHPESELELESLFEFLNNDTEFHPIIQSWMLHFKILSLPMFTKAKNKFASLLQSFWLRKHNMDLNGLLSLEHELYIKKNEYLAYFPEKNKSEFPVQEQHLNEQLAFGLSLHANQLSRMYLLLQSYFRKQIDYEKLNPRQKNIMNFVFQSGYKLKEIDDSILNKRQKLIMYIIQHRGFVSTKELVSEFDCNRKTIQRDFVHLLELNLVKIIGLGSALKYSLNLDNHKQDPINQYQSEYLKNSDEQVIFEVE